MFAVRGVPRVRVAISAAPAVIDLDVQQSRAAQDDFLHLLRAVIIEPRRHPETRTQRRAQHARARRRADERELRQPQLQTARLRSLVDDDVEFVVLHRGIEILLDRRLEPMDFVDEKDVALFQAREQSGQLARLFDHRSARVLDVHAHRVRDDVGERRLPEAGRSAEQDVLEHVAALLRRFDQDLESFTDLHLAGELAEHRRPQRNLEGRIRWWRSHHDDPENEPRITRMTRMTGWDGARDGRPSVAAPHPCQSV